MGFWNSVGKWLGAVPVPVPEPLPVVPVLRFRRLAEPVNHAVVKYARTTGPAGRYFKFEYAAALDPTVEDIRITAAPASEPWNESWHPHIRRGVTETLARHADTDRVVCMAVQIVAVSVHIVDTNPYAAMMAGRYFVDELVGEWSKMPELPPFPAAWRTDAVVGLARAAAEDGRFATLPVLADALEEVGCDDPLALAHLRTCTDHAPRCWVADWVLAAS